MPKLIMEIDIDMLLDDAESRPQVSRNALARVLSEVAYSIKRTKVWVHRPAKIKQPVSALGGKVGYWQVVKGHQKIGIIPDDV